MGYLEELKRQADAALAQQTQDIGALQRNALLTDAACQTASRYFGALARQLNVLQPVSKAVWRFDSRTSFSQLRFSDFLLAFPDRPALCTVHHHEQVWWQTTYEALARALREG